MRKKQTLPHMRGEDVMTVATMLGVVIIGAIILMLGLLVDRAKAEASDPRYPLLEQSSIQQAHHVRHHRKQSKPRPVIIDASGNLASGIIQSRKTGATARVAAQYAPQFQAYIDELENNHGATIRFIGGIRRGKCWSGGLHPCGKAIDVCQLSRGRVDARCHLPGRLQIAEIAARHGLFEGGRWCSSDYGHVQVGTTAGDCGSHYAKHRKHKMAMR